MDEFTDILLMASDSGDWYQCFWPWVDCASLDECDDPWSVQMNLYIDRCDSLNLIPRVV